MRTILIFLFFILIYACNKDKVRSTQTELFVFNASPNAGKLQLLQNLKQVGGAEFDYVTNLTPAIAQYQLVDSGFQNYKIKKGSTEFVNTLLSTTSTRASFFMYDSLTNLKYFLIGDNLDTPGNKFAKIRIMHLAPDVDTFNLALNGGFVRTTANTAVDWVFYTNQLLVTSSGLAGFFNVDTGNYAIQIRQKNPQIVLRNYNYKLLSNGVYTLVVKGYKNRSGADSLSLSIVQH